MATRKYTTLPWIEYTVATGNYGTVRSAIDRIILHSTASKYAAAIAWFGNPAAGTSAHYIVSNKGELAAMLEEYNTAYHSGNLIMNKRSIGIETEGYAGMVRSNEEYTMTARLVADICKFYAIPCNRTYVLPHREIVATACPTDLDVDRVIKEANAILKPPVSPTDPCANVKKELADLKVKHAALQKKYDELKKRIRTIIDSA